jgi:hypothetical protein
MMCSDDWFSDVVRAEYSVSLTDIDDEATQFAAGPLGVHRVACLSSSSRCSRKPVGICSIHCCSAPGRGKV